MKGVAKLFGGGMTNDMKRAQAEQAAMLAEERRKIGLLEDAQARTRSAGRGLLAYVDNLQSDLAQTLGGGKGSP